MRCVLCILFVAGIACRFAAAPAGGSPAVTPTPKEIVLPPGASNPFGVMLGAQGMTIEQRIALAQVLGAVYFRPNSVFVESWGGRCDECAAARESGLKLILTVRNNGGAGAASRPPVDLEAYRRALGQILDQTQPAILIVENEENSGLFYAGSPEEYAVQLGVACEVAHARGIQCANGGPVSLLVALLVYNAYLENGDTVGAASFAKRVFTAEERDQLASSNAREQAEKGRRLLQVYRAANVDFVNFHWYISDPDALIEAAAFLIEHTGRPVMTNEIGQHDPSPVTVTNLMATVLELELPYAVWFSVDAPKAQALMEPDGTLRESGLAFQQFVRTHFP